METYIIADNIVSPLGFTSEDNFSKVREGLTGISMINNGLSGDRPVWASWIKADPSPVLPAGHSRFESLCISSVAGALSGSGIDGQGEDTIFILSTTKGNIQAIEKPGYDMIRQASLDKSAKAIAAHFHAAHKPIVVSNACISGVLAIIIAKRLLEAGKYKHAVVVGADELSRFVISGFQGLMAMSDEPCRPFDKDRKGINLGEGAATVVMTTDKSLVNERSIIVMGEGVTNDANHISGPSRTGQELADAVSNAMQKSKIKADDLSFISAHGTATTYNDEMESNAFDIAGLNHVPLHSLKGYFGHTLGAAGLIESIMTIHSLRNQCVLASRNFNELGLPKSLNVNKAVVGSDKYHALKTASGFGGCNAAIVYSVNI